MGIRRTVRAADDTSAMGAAPIRSAGGPPALVLAAILGTAFASPSAAATALPGQLWAVELTPQTVSKWSGDARAPAGARAQHRGRHRSFAATARQGEAALGAESPAAARPASRVELQPGTVHWVRAASPSAAVDLARRRPAGLVVVRLGGPGAVWRLAAPGAGRILAPSP